MDAATGAIPAATPIPMPTNMPMALVSDLVKRQTGDVAAHVARLMSIDDMGIPLAGIANKNVGDCFE